MTQSADKQPDKQSPQKTKHGFPGPAVTLVEFADNLGLLFASQTEQDTARRRVVLKKVAYIRISSNGWGGTAFPEVWIEQSASGTYQARETKTGAIFQHPSRRQYEVVFLSRDIFDMAIQCLKQRNLVPLLELVMVTFSTCEGFELDSGALVGPDDYAALREIPPKAQWIPPPTPFKS